MRTLVLYNLYVRRTAGVLIAVCTVSVFLYGAFLLMAVSHAARLSSAQEQIRTLTSQLSAAESAYLSRTETLDMGSATTMGLTKPASVSIVYASTPAALSFNH